MFSILLEMSTCQSGIGLSALNVVGCYFERVGHLYHTYITPISHLYHTYITRQWLATCLLYCKVYYLLCHIYIYADFYSSQSSIQTRFMLLKPLITFVRNNAHPPCMHSGVACLIAESSILLPSAAFVGLETLFKGANRHPLSIGIENFEWLVPWPNKNTSRDGILIKFFDLWPKEISREGEAGF